MPGKRVFLLPMLGFDVVAYSNNTNPDQHHIQTSIQEMLERAERQLGDQIVERFWLDRGDGGIAAMVGHIEVGPALLKHFCSELRMWNKHRQPLVELRFALHLGIVCIEELPITRAASGNGINDLSRLLEIMPHDKPDLVVISSAYYRLLVEATDTPHTLFHPMDDLVDRHGKTHGVWNYYTDDFGVDPAKL